MNKYAFLRTLLLKPWAIDDEHAQGAGTFIAGILNPNLEFVEAPEPNENKPYCISAANSNIVNSYDKAPKGSTAIIPIVGELMKYDQFCGPVGMATLGERIKEADSHKNISSIMLVFDTPGGSVDGIETLASVIKNTQKPTTAYIDGTLASGGVWLAVHADKIIASNQMDRIGSIGVMTSFVDMQPMWELAGVKFHEVYSTLSKDKNKLFKEMRSGNYENYQSQVLDPLAEQFRSVVKENRPNSTIEQMTGKMFFAKDVVGSLIDEIASFEKAISITQNLKQKNSNKVKIMENLKHISAIVGVDAFEVSEGGIFLSEEQALAIETALENKQTTDDAKKAEFDQVVTESANQLKQIEELQLQNMQLSEQIEVLQKAPAKKAAEVVVDTNAVKKDANPCIVNESDDFITAMQKVGEAYL